MPLQFELPASFSADKFIATLNDKADIQLISRSYCLRTYYDSFDWRLWAKGIVCEFNRSKSTSTLTLRTVKKGEVIASCDLSEIPPFPKLLPPGAIRDTLQTLLDMRALLAVSTLEYEDYQLELVSQDNTPLARLHVEDYELCNDRVIIQPANGSDESVKNLVSLLTRDLGVIAVHQPVLLAALELQGRKPGDYSSKLEIKLDPEQRAEGALKKIYLRLLKTIKDNEQGTLADIDSEFLHDFRVSLRRTRSGLTQLKGVLPKDRSDYFSDFFSWLGQATSPVRDLDVYFSHFDQYKESLPENIRDALDPLYYFLIEKKQKARKAMVHNLKSAKYKTTLLEWEEYLKQPQQVNPAAPNAHIKIKELADLRLWKLYKRARKQGDAITPQSPPDALHRLRKTCKKLRYLMEFFQNFYPEHQIKPLLKDLKKLQEVLGDFQDFSVQKQSIKTFSEEMSRHKTPAETFLAMGMLIQLLDIQKCEARKHFASRFNHFKRKHNHSAFQSLFGNQHK